jgi:hypothetical protein
MFKMQAIRNKVGNKTTEKNESLGNEPVGNKTIEKQLCLKTRVSPLNKLGNDVLCIIGRMLSVFDFITMSKTSKTFWAATSNVYSSKDMFTQRAAQLIRNLVGPDVDLSFLCMLECDPYLCLTGPSLLCLIHGDSLNDIGLFINRRKILSVNDKFKPLFEELKFLTKVQMEYGNKFQSQDLPAAFRATYMNGRLTVPKEAFHDIRNKVLRGNLMQYFAKESKRNNFTLPDDHVFEWIPILHKLGWTINMDVVSDYAISCSSINCCNPNGLCSCGDKSWAQQWYTGWCLKVMKCLPYLSNSEGFSSCLKRLKK